MSTNSGGTVRAQVPGPAAPANPARYGEVFDRGYAHYDGERLGRRQAFRSLIGYSMKRALGLRKSWTAKVLPFLMYTAAIIPLIVMIGISAIIPESGTIIVISFIVLTSVAQIGMELLGEFDWSRYLILLSGIDTFQGVSAHLFQDVSNLNVERADLSLAFYVTYCLALGALVILFLRWRYAPRDDA